MLPKMKEIVKGLPSLEKVIIVSTKGESYSKDISEIKNGCFLNEFLELGREKDGSIPPIQFEQVSYDHPLFINYTSGTTGLPKPLVHGIGYLLAVFRDFSMHLDAHRGSVYFSMSPVGWATWNCFTSLLFAGVSVVLYEGVPFFRSPTYFWDLVDELKMTHIFIPSSILNDLQNRGYIPTKNHSLKSLKLLMSGGSVVKSQLFDFVYSSIKKDMAFTSVFGKPLDGEVGELVVTKPIPNLPLGLWKDKDGSLLREKYFYKYPGKFAIGDYGVINPVTRGLTICCRSDETLKQRGCRFGSSEIYNVVEIFPEVTDSICVSQYNKTMDERAVLFLKIRDGYSFSEDLVSRIREAISNELTIRHVPDIILEVKDIPYNANGKKMEIMAKKIINRMPYNAETIVNPESLTYYENVPELQGF
ncbi:unnamed protein product [Larinioides sclopetarius]|uniref:AMP-dependent synthetase/ligase domain-containing protein n=1 Tax=Larinioides sclopetarius TaxID=280406 RepID=A0AAV2C032_9ARAC